MMDNRTAVCVAALFTVLVLAWALPSGARAHGTGTRWLEDERALAVYFHYSTGEPMSWVKVRVFGPGDGKLEFVSARTDRNGRFAFLPDTPGHWRVEALDEQGHRAMAETEFAPMADKAKGPAAVGMAGDGKDGGDRQIALPVTWRAVLGVSLILNGFLAAMLMRRRNRTGTT